MRNTLKTSALPSRILPLRVLPLRILPNKVVGHRLMVVAMLGVVICIAGSASASADENEKLVTPEPEVPVLAAASGEGFAAIASFKFPGLKCELFAAEPDIGNPIAIHRDYQGRIFAAESYRQEKGIEDNRNHAYWMDEELQAQTVQDRINYILKYHPDANKTYTQFDDRIRVLTDADGDGKADVSKVFANRFNDLEMGSGAGVLSYRDKVYYTCIPHLFSLTDTDGDLVADERKSLHSGYGVRFAFRGHDSHGLIVGPDGRLYFSIGDRGYNITDSIRDPESGAVFRCDLDGSNLEVFATGLRNPQELAFDEYGNLFTGDNNSDGGDEARWTYVVQGGDSGWRMYYQYLGDRGPWNRELIWDDENKEKPAYVIPCIKNISDGPSGLEYYPGTGFSEDFNNRFFLCDFRGGPSNSGVRSFRNKRAGAFFELVDDEKPIWQTLCTDIDFGSDGKLYLSDWVFGWVGEEKGRIYTFFDENYVNSDIVKEVESILRVGMSETPTAEVVDLLSHKDQRVRQEAQFELVARKETNSLLKVVLMSDETLPRLHAMWGMGQLLRSGFAIESLDSKLPSLLGDVNEHVRRETAKLIADFFPQHKSLLENLCSDESAIVRYQAALGLGAIGDTDSMNAITDLLIENDDADPIVRHGGIMAIKGIAIREAEAGKSGFVESLMRINVDPVKLATIVGLRKQHEHNQLHDKQSTDVMRLLSTFLADDNSTVVLEAARAVHDLQMDSAMEPLAKLISQSNLSDHLLRRAISANNRIGDAASATRLANFAANSSAAADRKLDALRLLKQWENPEARDPVSGAWREVDKSKRNVADAAAAVKAVFADLVAADSAVVAAAVDVAAALKIEGVGQQVESIVFDANAEPKTRGSALASLEQLNYAGLDQVMQRLLAQGFSVPPELEAVKVDVLSRTNPEAAVALLFGVLAQQGSEPSLVTQKQKALATLSKMKDPASEGLLATSLDSLQSGSLEKELQLDLITAAEKRGGAIAKTANEWLEKQSSGPAMSDKYAWAMHGGNPENGKLVFYEKTAVSCVRCHRIDGLGGKVGPNLSGVGVQYDRRGVLESVVDPNLKIAVGHGQIVVATDDGLMHTGIVKEETETQIALMDPDGVVTRLDIDTIEDRKEGKSSMPEGLADQLTRDELRDLIEYLVQRSSPVSPEQSGHE